MAKLNVTISGIANNQPIPMRFAFCVPDGKGQKKSGNNIRPAIRWSESPGATKSYAVIIVDKDVPTSFETANEPSKTIPFNMPRKNFYHLVQVDIPADTTYIPEGEAGKITPGISGLNDYGKRGSMQGVGYDGPCPPWNDERIHNYHFQVYALDVPSLELSSDFTGEDAEEAMQGHILAKGEVIGTYTTNQNTRYTA